MKKKNFHQFFLILFYCSCLPQSMIDYVKEVSISFILSHSKHFSHLYFLLGHVSSQTTGKVAFLRAWETISENITYLHLHTCVHLHLHTCVKVFNTCYWKMLHDIALRRKFCMGGCRENILLRKTKRAVIAEF